MQLPRGREVGNVNAQVKGFKERDRVDVERRGQVFLASCL